MPVRMREAAHRLCFSLPVQVARFVESSKENLFNQLYRIILKIKGMSNVNEQRATIETPIFGSEKMRNSAPTETIPMHPTSPEIAYQMDQGRDLSADPAAPESGHFRNDLYGRLRLRS